MIRKLILLCCLTSFLFVCKTNAQNDFFGIVGPQELCEGECGLFFVQPVTPTVEIFEIVWSNGTVGDSAVYCMDSLATLTVSVEAFVVFDDGNQAIATDTLLVSPLEEDLQANIFSNAGQFCPSANQPGSSPNAGCDTVCAGSTLTYRWEVFGGVAGSLASVQVTGSSNFSVFPDRVEVEWGSPGPGTVNFLFSGQCPGFLERSICVEVLEDPIADFETQPPLQNDTLYVCQGREIQLTNTSQFADQFFWSFGNGESSTESNPAYAYPEPGTYQLELRAANVCQCEDTRSITVVVEKGEVPVVDCVGTLCEGGLGTYTATTGCGTLLWEVSDNGTIIDGGDPTDDYITVEWGAGPEGIVRLSVEDCPAANACTAPYEVIVPILSEAAQVEGNAVVCRGEVSNYSVTPYQGTSFEWEVSDFGTILEGQGSPNIVVQWRDDQIAPDTQWVAVELDNCYLGCGGRDTLEVNMRPEFRAFGPIEICQGDSTTHQARSIPGSSPVESDWVVTDALGDTVWVSPAPTSAPTIPWTGSPGLYRIITRPAAAEDYCTEGYQSLMQVIGPPPPVQSIDGATQICPGQLYTFEAVSDQQAVQFFWQINDGGSIIQRQGKRITLSFGPNPPYSLEVFQENAFGCRSAVALQALNPLPPFTISGPGEACNQAISTFTAQDYPIDDYNWSISPESAGTIIAGAGTNEIMVAWNAAGTAQVRLNACSQSVSQEVIVHALPEPAAVHPAFVCPGDLGTVATAQPYANYQWSDASGSLISTDSSLALPEGFYQLQVTDGNGCQRDTFFNIKAYGEPAVNITTPDPNVFCGITPFTRLYAIDNGVGYDYQWFMDGNPVGANSDQYTATDFGAYRVEITDQNGCTAVSNTILVLSCGGAGVPSTSTVCPEDINFSMSGSGRCEERSYQALLGPSYVPGTVAWNFDDPGSGLDNFAFVLDPSHSYQKAGYYRVQLQADFVDPTGMVVTCDTFRVDTIYAVANFISDEACSGSATAFMDLSTFLPEYPIASWEWDFGDPASGADNTSTDQNPTHVYSAPGTYTATLTISSSAGCTSEFSQDVEVLPSPDASFGLPMADCEGTALAFTAPDDSTIVEVAWNFGDPASGAADSSTAFTAYHGYNSPGTYQVTLATLSSLGCSNTAQQSITIVGNTLGGAITPSNPVICEGSSATLAAPAGGTSWLWSNGATTEQITVEESGLYRVTVSNDNGCTYVPDPAVVAVDPLPTDTIRAVEFNDFGFPIGFTYDTLRVCEGEDVTLRSIGNPDYSYSWSTGAVGTSIEFTEDRGNQLSAGTYEYSLTVLNDSSGCSREVGPFVVIVNPLPSAVIAAQPAGARCEGEDITFTVDSPNPAWQYIWNNGAEGPSMQTSEAGQFFVTAINTFGCEAQSNLIEIQPGPDISLVPNGCYSRCQPDTLCLPAIPNIASYQWFFNGSPIGSPQPTVPELIADQSGSYWLEMVSNNGCQLQSDPLDLELFDGLGALSGQVFVDVNANGIIDGPDTAFAGAAIDLLQNGSGLGIATSNSSGNYAFPNLENGAYSLSLDTTSLPAGFFPNQIQVDTSFAGCGINLSINWLLEDRCQGLDTAFVDLTGCDSLMYNGQVFNRDTSFLANFTNAFGCDSTELVSISLGTSQYDTLSFRACSGELVDYNGNLLAAGSSQQFTFLNAAGCDSVVTVIVEELQPSATTLELSACSGTSAEYNGNTLQPGSSQQFIFTNAAGCDSVVTVSVEELPTSETALELGACSGSSITYNGTVLFPGAAETFTFTNSAGCDSIVNVTVVEALPTDTLLEPMVCESETFEIGGSMLSAGDTATFTLTNAAGCDSVVNVQVGAWPPISAETDLMPPCPGASDGAVVIEASGSPGFQYALNGGSFQTLPAFTGLAPGGYTVDVRDGNGCSTQLSFELRERLPLQVELQLDSMTCSDPTARAQAIVQSGLDSTLTLSWSNGDSGQDAVFELPGSYTLTARNACEELIFPFVVAPAAVDPASLLYLPNAFSPDGNGRNDVYRAYLSTDATWEEFWFMIFDRWGNMLFETRDPDEGWDGIMRDERMNTGVYVYYLEGTIRACGGQRYEIRRKGDVTLVR